jgi:hypothetical protein
MTPFPQARPTGGEGVDLAEVHLGDAEPAEHFAVVAPGPKGATVIVMGRAAGGRHVAAARARVEAFAAYTDDPLHVLTLVNQTLVERGCEAGDALSAVCVTYDPRGRRLRWATAGHAPPRALDSGEGMGEPGAASLALGVDAQLRAVEGHARLAPGEGFVVHTGGLREALRGGAAPATPPRGGDCREQDVLRGLRGQDAQAVADGVRAAAGPDADVAVGVVVVRTDAVSDRPSRSEAIRERQSQEANRYR